MMPKALKGNKGARRAWRRIIVPAVRSGAIDAVLDSTLAVMFCQYAGEVTQLDALIRENPGAEIGLDPSVLRTMRRRDAAADRVLRFAGDLGLSPLGRLRLGHRDAQPKKTAEAVRSMLFGAMSTTEPTKTTH